MSETFVGSPAGTAYGTYAAAVIYIDARLGDAYRAWEALAEADRKRAMLTATSFLDAMAWLDDYATFAARDAVAAFVSASYELAALVAADPGVVTVADQGNQIQTLSAGGASITYFHPTSARTGSASLLPPVLMRLVGQYLAASEVGGPQGGSSQKGSNDNPFSACEDYDANGAW